MGLIGSQVLAYGHSADAAEGIEGLELLEEHYAKLRKEANGDVGDGSDVEMDVGEDDDEGWEGWEAESDSEADSNGWESVSSGGEDLEISDSEDESDKRRDKKDKREKKRLARGKGKAKAEDGETDEDEEMDDAVSVAATEATEASQTTKKLSLLAQQRVRLFDVYAKTYTDPPLHRFLHLQTLSFLTNSVSRRPKSSLLPAVAPLPSASLLLWKPPSDMLAKTKRTDSLPRLRFWDRERRPRRLGRRGWRVFKRDEKAERSLVV